MRSLLATIGWLVVAGASSDCASAGVPPKLVARGDSARSFSGIYPHLASFNSQGECGIGAVAVWADHLWWVTYSPHRPKGSDDKLYSTNRQADFFVWPGSVGGTPANRMLHRETQQLLIGPYVIDTEGRVRVIPPERMPGRLTGNARHLTDPTNKVYYATMEEGFYEVDMRSLDVTELFPDANFLNDKAGTLLPGYHGKGFYSGQGRVVNANNGEKSSRAMTDPDIPSGSLAEWSGNGPWRVVRRNQFTDVTGPGGLLGNSNPPRDPIWSIGWDHRSLVLALLDHGRWHYYRLPKASHCYDGAHGWNTEWPRIRDIGEQDLLMTMHGMFWRFPSRFREGQTAGIAPRSTYLKVIADFCRFDDRIVFGCDDSAKHEFLNTRKAKGKLAGPAVSHSNLWFVEPELLDHLGPAIGRGAVWLDDRVSAGTPSDAFLFAGFSQRAVHLVHNSTTPVTFHFEVDRTGRGQWEPLRNVVVPSDGYGWSPFGADETGTWIRVSVDHACRATAWFEMREQDMRNTTSATRFAGLAQVEEIASGRPPRGVRSQSAVRGGILRAGDRQTGLQILATEVIDGSSHAVGYYELKPDLSLLRFDSTEKQQWMAEKVAINSRVLRLDGGSVLFVDDSGRRFRLPIGKAVYRQRPELLDLQRTAREVSTERDIFQCAGTFYELPARNAGGFPKIRPIATHPFFVEDYCSWRGLLVLSGLSRERSKDNPRVIRSDDGGCAVWLGTIDDLWSLGKPRGYGGPWEDTVIERDTPSDPYLMAGFDHKRLELSHDSERTVSFRVEVDITGTGHWHAFHTLDVAPTTITEFPFPDGFEAYWVRLVADQACRATAVFRYW